jgi:hypothetical protein
LCKLQDVDDFRIATFKSINESTSNFAAYLEVVCESKQMAEYWSRDLQDLVLGPEESCHLLNLVDLLLIYC